MKVFVPSKAVSATARNRDTITWKEPNPELWWNVTFEDGSERFAWGPDEASALAYAQQREDGEAESNNRWLKLAWESEPDGRTCGICGKPNDFADDCGFWYIEKPDPIDAPYVQGEGARKWPMVPACEACFRGPVGHRHQEKYGVGER